MEGRIYINSDKDTYYDFDRHCFFLQGKKADKLRKMLEKVLKCLAENYPNTVTYSILYEKTRGDDACTIDTEAGLLNSDVNQIKKWFSDQYGIELDIQNHAGIGYSCPYKLEKTDETDSSSKNGDTKVETLVSQEEKTQLYPQSILSTLSLPAEYCKSKGVIGFSDEAINMIPFLEDKTKIYILGTTSANLISRLAADFIPQKLREKTDFYVLLANKNSEFDEDAALIEDRTDNLSTEFVRSISYLKKAVMEAKKNSDSIGKTYVGCCFTLLRQTVTIGVDEAGNAWGWLTMTLPPKRAISGTPSFVFEGNIHKKESLAHLVFNHVNAIKEEAENRSAYVEITSDTNPDTFYFRPRYKTKTRKEWEELQNDAQKTMEEAHECCQGELIEVAASHPLVNGKPSQEFQSRLDYAFELYKVLRSRYGAERINIYIPGSIHVHDNCSLSDAGIRYLSEKGVPIEDLIGEEANQRYKGEYGVYNSADECFVAAKLFFNGRYRHIRSVCSPNQMLRKQLFYLQFSVIPMFYTVPLESGQLAHDLIYEVFDTIPDVLYHDHTWQSLDSIDGNRTRRERQPNINQ